MTGIELFESWLYELVYPGDFDELVEIVSQGGQGEPDKPAEHHMKVNFYTSEHRYHIIAIERSDDTSYLGCQVSARKKRPGETWYRGNDLPDGDLNEKTWEQIKNAIIANELEKLSVIKPSNLPIYEE
jgi:hypothetical protein